MTEYSFALRLFMFGAYMVLMWKGHTTFEILMKFRPFVIAGVFIIFAMLIGVATGMWQSAGAEKANELIQPWCELAAWGVAGLLLPYVVLLMFSICGVVIQGLWKLITMPPPKKKGTPQFTRDAQDLSRQLFYDGVQTANQLALHVDDNASIDLRFDSQTDTDRYSILRGRNQP